MSLRPFRTQADWTPENIQAVSDAIRDGRITTAVQLQKIVGNQSKKLYPNGTLTVGSQMLGQKLKSYKDMNTAEHQFYKANTRELGNLDKVEVGFNKLLKFDENQRYKEYKSTHPELDSFTGKVYDFTMGQNLAEKGIEMMQRARRGINRDQASDLLLAELREIARLRGEENRLFNELNSIVPSQREAIQSHENAERKEFNSIRQIEEYLENPNKINELKSEARNYQKYLKYKAKYLALKKQLEQKN